MRFRLDNQDSQSHPRMFNCSCFVCTWHVFIPLKCIVQCRKHGNKKPAISPKRSIHSSRIRLIVPGSMITNRYVPLMAPFNSSIDKSPEYRKCAMCFFCFSFLHVYMLNCQLVMRYFDLLPILCSKHRYQTGFLFGMFKSFPWIWCVCVCVCF